MDTDKLNHELQIFRNHVKIARENIIHKLVRDIKFWKAKQETNADNKRATKKMESLVALMGHIKAQPASELTKAIIRFNPKKTNGAGQDLTERALARFHENKKLLPEVRALIRRFGLNSKMEVLDKYLKKRKDDEKKKKKSRDKIQSKKRKKVPNVKQDVVELESEDQGFCETVAEANESMGTVSGSDSEDDNGKEKVGLFVKATPTKQKQKVTQNKTQVANKKVKQAKKERKEKNISPEDEDSESKCVQVQDNFFVTSSGQSYVATAPVVDQKQQQQENEEEFSWKRANKRKDNSGKKDERFQKRPYREDINEDDEGQSSWKSKQQQKGQSKRFGEKNEDLDLHPSWAAKQKQRGIQTFAGKKTKIESNETETVSAAEDLHPSWAAKQKQKGLKPFQGKKIVFDSSEQGQQTLADDVHPSWAAKQKQQGIKAFQGKKVIFDTTEVRSGAMNNDAAPADLHPSWAAKQKEKGILEFRGKKITFDD
ncbi:uncharacterized protein LOC134224686 isoform X2 [Armigeres subalbatus]|uniref:uncharacterized protein LOC134224686 isoform X2 n=1 Tax=Armigeres subalbatus TaxID=124917 RepID=UPI002ED25F27